MSTSLYLDDSFWLHYYMVAHGKNLDKDVHAAGGWKEGICSGVETARIEDGEAFRFFVCPSQAIECLQPAARPPFGV